jgi:X-X-X-Leu-X-X-Gly heptad repeat protein
VVILRRRRAQNAITASPMNLSSVPPWASTMRPAASKNRPSMATTSSGAMNCPSSKVCAALAWISTPGMSRLVSGSARLKNGVKKVSETSAVAPTMTILPLNSSGGMRRSITAM